MDILDIDEALKDDSFIFLEEKTHDDVSNILQQWKSNNCIPPTLQSQHQQQPPSPVALHQQQEQVYKLNSRTFTRPKRKLAQNLETQFSTGNYNNGSPQPHNMQQHKNTPMLNLEIGGLVTTMHKSFLQDTSPPSSICSSIDVSMNNSLITSADFSNIHFLQSTHSMDLHDMHNGGILEGGFNLADKVTSDGYSLSDMIRDRKALESLTMSGDDGTLTKDSHIAQIDDISLTLCKTASGCSTMDNSTESVESNNRTVEIVNCKDRTYSGGVKLNLTANTADGTAGGELAQRLLLQQTMILSDEMIGDTTFNLVENSMYASHQEQNQPAACNNNNNINNNKNVAVPTAAAVNSLNITHNVLADEVSCCAEEQLAGNETFKKPMPLNETLTCIANASTDAVTSKSNTTFYCQDQHTPTARCETPESNTAGAVATMKFCESTPQTTSVRYNKQHYTPSLQIADDVNISPIIATPVSSRLLNETYERRQNQVNAKIKMETFTDVLPQLDSMELLENIENPNETFDKLQQQQQQQQQQAVADIEMQNVMDLAQAEAELLAGNGDEAEFEHMLDEFSKVELNAEQLKMKKSLDSIKKRFSYGMNAVDREISREAKDMRELMRTSAELQQEEMRNAELKKLRDSLRESRESKVSALKEALHNSSHNSSEQRSSRDTTGNVFTASSISSGSNSTVGSSSERLLSRRSRLYDDINLSTFSGGSSKSMGTSFTVQKHESASEESGIEASGASATKETEIVTEEEQQQLTEAKTELAAAPTASPEQMQNEQEVALSEATTPAVHKLAEKRERDRDRFKTIKINKPRPLNADDISEEALSECATELNVPCIDDEESSGGGGDIGENANLNTSQRYSRRDHVSPPAATTNEYPAPTAEEQQKTKLKSKINTNYLTYKKPKDKQLNNRNLPEVMLPPEPSFDTVPKTRLEPRSLSRPRYINGLQKFSAVSKATSAGDLEKSNCKQLNLTLANDCSTANPNVRHSAHFNRTQPVGGGKVVNELKSPMGTKSKSFHNLSSNFGYGASTAANTIQKTSGFGLKKPTNMAGILTEKQAKLNQMRTATNTTTTTNAKTNLATLQQQVNEESVFKVPKLVSGIRAPGITKRAAGLVRPSSGYYSFNDTAKIITQIHDNNDSDTGGGGGGGSGGGSGGSGGRHSPTDSMSSASSRSSIHSGGTTNNVKSLQNGPTKQTIPAALTATTTLTKITTGSTGIPKPSGLRPPTSIKRSGLPKPASIVKR